MLKLIPGFLFNSYSWFSLGAMCGAGIKPMSVMYKASKHLTHYTHLNISSNKLLTQAYCQHLDLACMELMVNSQEL